MKIILLLINILINLFILSFNIKFMAILYHYTVFSAKLLSELLPINSENWPFPLNYYQIIAILSIKPVFSAKFIKISLKSQFFIKNR